MTTRTRSALFGIVLLPILSVWLQAQTAPTISSVSGTVAHGQAVTLSGSAFGTKPTAAPVKYDDFQGLANGQDLSASGWTTAGYHKPIASSALLRPGTPFARNARAWFNGAAPFSQSGDVSNFYLTGKTFTKAYLDFWMYADSRSIGAAKPQNIKIFRLHQTGAGDPNAYFSTTVTPGGGGDSMCAARDGTTTTEWPGCDPSTLANNGNIPNNAFPGTEFWDKWHHFQVQTAAGSNGSANGTWILYVDGKLRYNRPGNIAMTRSGFDRWMEIYFGNYIRSEEWDGEAYFYWEAVYADNAWARVELGDASTYAASRHREIQIPSAWSTTAITVRVNAGSFPAGAAAWLYVIDSNGVASPGRAVTIGGGAPSTCQIAADNTPLNFPAAGGSLNVSVQANLATCAWTAASNQPWLTPSMVSATGTASVTFTAIANGSTTARGAVATVAGSTIAVTQAGAVVVPPVGQTVYCWRQDTSVTPPLMLAVPCTP